LEFKAELPTEIALLPEAASAVKVVKTLTMFVDPERVMVPFFAFCPKLNPSEKIRIADNVSFIVFIECSKDAMSISIVVSRMVKLQILYIQTML